MYNLCLWFCLIAIIIFTLVRVLLIEPAGFACICVSTIGSRFRRLATKRNFFDWQIVPNKNTRTFVYTLSVRLLPFYLVCIYLYCINHQKSPESVHPLRDLFCCHHIKTFVYLFSLLYNSTLDGNEREIVSFIQFSIPCGEQFPHWIYHSQTPRCSSLRDKHTTKKKKPLPYYISQLAP